jgi:hypothetical protein
MTKSKRQKSIHKTTKVDELKKELQDNDAILKKNEENPRLQIQIGLYRKGFPQISPMYDSLIEKMQLDIEEMQLKVDSDFALINPTFAFQTIPRWREIQKTNHQKSIQATKDNLKEIEVNVELVKTEIQQQNERIIARREQILEELQKLGVDVADYKKPDYVG